MPFFSKCKFSILSISAVQAAETNSVTNWMNSTTKKIQQAESDAYNKIDKEIEKKLGMYGKLAGGLF